MSVAFTERQQAWLDAATTSSEPATALFRLIALPNEHERGHSCIGHSVGFRRHGRRGFKCGVCSEVLKWVDAA